MRVEVFKPKNKKLEKYINCFYILTHSKTDKKTSYFTFPSTLSIVSAISNVTVNQTPDEIIIKESKTNSFDSSLDVKFTNPLYIEYEGIIKEITICFKPLGLNAFLDKHLDNYCNEESSQFIPFTDYKESTQRILKIDNKQTLIKQIENYWVSKLKGFNHPFLHQSVQSIITNPNLAITDIAKSNNISHKTLIYQFKKHLCKTPTAFRKIVRFRKALKNNNMNLTELSYLSNYFDQAHMIKDFKSLTGYTPKDFFNNLSSSKDEIINWVFI